MLEEAIYLVKQGDPSAWPKTKDNKQKVDRMGLVLANLTGEHVDCSWCARSSIYKHLRKYLDGNGHL